MKGPHKTLSNIPSSSEDLKAAQKRLVTPDAATKVNVKDSLKINTSHISEESPPLLSRNCHNGNMRMRMSPARSDGLGSVITDSCYSSDATDSDLDDEILQAIDSEHDVDSDSENGRLSTSRHGGSHVGASGNRAGSNGSGSNPDGDSDSDDDGFLSDDALRSPGVSECADDERDRA